MLPCRLQITPPHAILASNTSAISITRLAAATHRPDRVVSLAGVAAGGNCAAAAAAMLARACRLIRVCCGWPLQARTWPDFSKHDRSLSQTAWTSTAGGAALHEPRAADAAGGAGAGHADQRRGGCRSTLACAPVCIVVRGLSSGALPAGAAAAYCPPRALHIWLGPLHFPQCGPSHPPWQNPGPGSSVHHALPAPTHPPARPLNCNADV